MERYWVPKLSPKQLELFNSYDRYLLVSGPKLSGKTIGLVHKVIRHAFDTDRARVGIFAKTMKVAKDGGVWADLVDMALPEWIDNVGLEVLTPTAYDPATGATTVITAHDPDTRQPYVIIRNRYGTQSKIVMNSLDYEGDVEALVKGKRFSMIYFNELSNFRSRKVFDFTADALRCPWLKWSDHQWVADTNPADQGTDSWIYQLWYETLFHPELDEQLSPEQRQARAALRPNLRVIEIAIKDNPFLTPEQHADMMAKFGHDPVIAARYLEGKWVRASYSSVFADVFRFNTHVVGQVTSGPPATWEVLLPEQGCSELVTGWDIGSVNHAIVIVEPFILRGQPAFKVLDEVVVVGTQVKLEDLVNEVMDAMDRLEYAAGQPILWRHWSDRSAFDAYRPAAERYDCALVQEASRGRIELRAAPKFSGSVAQALRMIRQLLFENRLFVSAHCTQTIEMFTALRAGRTPFTSVDRADPHKHVFDALSYALLSEVPPTIESRQTNPRPSRLVSVGSRATPLVPAPAIQPPGFSRPITVGVGV